MDCEEIRVDLRTIPHSAIRQHSAQLLFRLNHTLPFSEEYNALLRELLGDNLGQGSTIAPPLSGAALDMLKIGRDVFINSNLLAMARGGITIGDHARIAANVQLLSNTHDPYDLDVLTCKPVESGDYAWIGAGATILPGVRVGRHAIVGAASVVTKDVPDYAVAVGNPARVIKMLVNAAGVSPSQAPIEAILKVDLYGTAVLLEEVGKVIAPGGVGVTISSQSGWRMPALTAEQDLLLATTTTEELLSLDFLQPEKIRDTLHAYQLAKRCNEKRVMAQAVEWGKRGARLNDIAPGIIVTPLALDEFNGPRGDFYKNMFAKCPAGRPGTADEVANVAELLMSDKGAFITGSTFLIDGGATASYFYGPLKP